MSGWLLVLLGATLAATGTAVGVGAAALSRLELTRWAAQRLRGAAAAGALLGTPGRVQGTANVLATLGVLLASLGIAGVLGRVHPLALAVLVVLGAIPVLITATYALPRALARRWPQPVVRSLVPWVDRLGRVLGPLLPSSYSAPHRDVAALLRAGSGAELFEQDELIVLSGLLSFSERPARELMTARTDIVAVSEEESVANVAQMVSESGYSRLPVFRESLDHIVGMVYAFDLLVVPPGGALPVRPVVVAPASKPCADLLFEMQRERRQFAVLLDEFGGTAGIATLDDLLGALVGAVFGEPETPGAADGKAEGVLEVDGGAPASDLAARFEVHLPVAAETVGGLLTRLAGRIPRAGERFLLQGLEFDVLASSPTRVDRVVVRRTPVTVTSLPRGEGA
ncbi:MAG TPA: hemolysin family protein [Gemmatimonadales bacterium]|nr:hemolysin family protein [Gemmatimonadales bacterium]